MHKYSSTCRRNALLPIKLHRKTGAFVDFPNGSIKEVTRFGTWFQFYAGTCIQMYIECRRGEGMTPPYRGAVQMNWKKTGGAVENGKIILEISIDI